MNSAEALIAVKAAYDSAKAYYKDLVALHLQMAPLLQPETPATQEDLCDIGFLHRELAGLLDELKKECKAREEYIGKLVASRAVQESVNNMNAMTIKGQYCTGKPDVKYNAVLPSTGDPKYQDILRALGFPEDLVQNRLASIHWQHASELITRLAAEGKDLSFLEKRPCPLTIFHKRRDVTL